MKHALTISVARKPKDDGIAAVRSLTVRERMLRFLLGDKRHVTVIVPGDSVEELAIREMKEDTDETLRDQR